MAALLPDGRTACLALLAGVLAGAAACGAVNDETGVEAFGVVGQPMVVELGVALDVLVATLVLGVFFFQIREQFDSLDLHHLESLREDK